MITKLFEISIYGPYAQELDISILWENIAISNRTSEIREFSAGYLGAICHFPEG